MDHLIPRPGPRGALSGAQRRCRGLVLSPDEGLTMRIGDEASGLVDRDGIWLLSSLSKTRTRRAWPWPPWRRSTGSSWSRRNSRAATSMPASPPCPWPTARATDSRCRLSTPTGSTPSRRSSSPAGWTGARCLQKPSGSKRSAGRLTTGQARSRLGWSGRQPTGRFCWWVTRRMTSSTPSRALPHPQRLVVAQRLGRGLRRLWIWLSDLFVMVTDGSVPGSVLRPDDRSP